MHDVIHGRLSGRAALAALIVVALGCAPNEQRDDRPLADALGYTLSPSEARAVELRLEEAVARCMIRVGWKYEPVDYSAITSVVDVGADAAYGVMRVYELLELPSLDGHSPSRELGEFTDPNAEYLSMLTSRELDRFNRALSGTGDPAAPLREQGCRGEAMATVTPERDSAVQRRVAEFHESSLRDPRIAGAMGQWGECMRTHGYAYTTQAEVLPAIQTAKERAQTKPDGDLERLTDTEFRQLVALEHETFEADTACQETSGLADVVAEVEDEFLVALVAEFPALAD